MLRRLGEHLFRLGQLVGCLRTARFGLGNIGEQGAALFLDFSRHAFKRLEFGLGLVLAFFKRADLPLRIRRAKLPGIALLRDGGEPA